MPSEPVNQAFFSISETSETKIYTNNDVALIGVISNIRDIFINIKTSENTTRWWSNVLFDFTISSVAFSNELSGLQIGQTITMASDISSYRYSTDSPYLRI